MLVLNVAMFRIVCIFVMSFVDTLVLVLLQLDMLHGVVLHKCNVSFFALLG